MAFSRPGFSPSVSTQTTDMLTFLSSIMKSGIGQDKADDGSGITNFHAGLQNSLSYMKTKGSELNQASKNTKGKFDGGSLAIVRVFTPVDQATSIWTPRAQMGFWLTPKLRSLPCSEFVHGGPQIFEIRLTRELYPDHPAWSLVSQG